GDTRSRAVADHLDADTGLLGRAGPRREQHAVEPARARVVDRDLVVAQHLALRAQLVQVLHQVEDEAVVVVHDEDACAHPAAPVPPSTVTLLKGRSGSAPGKTYWKSR